MAKKSEAEVLLGFKRICPSCNTRYYDMGKVPPTCPHCSTEYNPEALLKSRRNRPLEDEEELKLKARKTPAAAAEDGEEAETPEVEAEEEAEVEEYAELDGEAELTPDEDAVDVADVDTDEEDDEDEDDNVLEDTSDLGDDDALVEVEIEKEEEI